MWNTKIDCETGEVPTEDTTIPSLIPNCQIMFGSHCISCSFSSCSQCDATYLMNYDGDCYESPSKKDELEHKV